jgi:hypothetical protein
LKDPNLKTGFARRMRAALPEALVKINAEFAVAFAESEKIDIARLHIGFLRGTEQSQSIIEKITEQVLTPVCSRLKEQIKSARDRGEKHPPEAAKVAQDLLQHSRKSLTLLDIFFGKDHELRNDLFDAVAGACNRLQVISYEVTSDEKTCIEILKSVLPLATAVELKQQIEKNIETLKGFVRRKQIDPVYALLKSIEDGKEIPSEKFARFKRDALSAIAKAAGVSGFSENYGYLSAATADIKELFDIAAIVLRGISLDAWNNHLDHYTAIEANKLAIRHATSDTLKQKLAEDKTILEKQTTHQVDGGPYGQRTKAGKRFSGESSSSFNLPEKVSPGMVVLGIVGLLVLWGIIGSCNSTTTSPHSTTYESHTPQPAPSPPWESTTPAPTAPAYTPPPATVDSGSGNKVYRVPEYVSNQLDQEKVAIEADRAVLKQLDDQLDSLGREIDNDRIYLDKTSQYAIDAFNAKVERYNTMSRQDKAATAAFNERVNAYNAKLRQYGH